MAPAKTKGAARRASAASAATETFAAAQEITTTTTTITAAVPLEAVCGAPAVEPEFAPGLRTPQEYKMRRDQTTTWALRKLAVDPKVGRAVRQRARPTLLQRLTSLLLGLLCMTGAYFICDTLLQHYDVTASKGPSSLSQQQACPAPSEGTAGEGAQLGHSQGAASHTDGHQLHNQGRIGSGSNAQRDNGPASPQQISHAQHVRNAAESGGKKQGGPPVGERLHGQQYGGTGQADEGGASEPDLNNFDAGENEQAGQGGSELMSRFLFGRRWQDAAAALLAATNAGLITAVLLGARKRRTLERRLTAATEAALSRQRALEEARHALAEFEALEQTRAALAQAEAELDRLQRPQDTPANIAPWGSLAGGIPTKPSEIHSHPPAEFSFPESPRPAGAVGPWPEYVEVPPENGDGQNQSVKGNAAGDSDASGHKPTTRKSVELAPGSPPSAKLTKTVSGRTSPTTPTSSSKVFTPPPWNTYGRTTSAKAAALKNPATKTSKTSLDATSPQPWPLAPSTPKAKRSVSPEGEGSVLPQAAVRAADVRAGSPGGDARIGAVRVDVSLGRAGDAAGAKPEVLSHAISYLGSGIPDSPRVEKSGESF